MRIFFFSLILLSFSEPSCAQSKVCELIRDKKLNGKVKVDKSVKKLSLKITYSSSSEFFGTFVGTGNNSVFEGKITRSERGENKKLVRMTQLDHDFMIVYTGILEDDKLVGSWFSSVGQKGDFMIPIFPN